MVEILRDRERLSAMQELDGWSQCEGRDARSEERRVGKEC